MFAAAIRHIVLFLVFSLALAVAGQAEVAPPGSFVRKTTTQSMLPEPPGNFRTRLVWLLASRIAYENRSMAEYLNPFFGTAVRSQFESQLKGERAHFAGLQEKTYYAYAEAMVRDLALLEIQMVQDSQVANALMSFGQGILADIAAEVVMKGAAGLAPKGPAVDLGHLHLVPGTEANFAYRRALQDLELRYRVLIDPALFDGMEEALKEGAVTMADVRELVSGSAVSSAIGTAIGAYFADARKSFDILRRETVLDVAAHGCACALREFDPGIAYKTHAAVLGSSGKFRTPLSFLLSQDLAPPQTTLLNIRGAPVVQDLLRHERKKIDRMKIENPAAYATYLRSLLVDIELLEQLQLEALDSGTAIGFIEGTWMNSLFGAAAAAVIPGSLAATITASVANAAYGAKVNYDTTSEAIRIRVRMAALREQTLDSLLPLSEVCGCGAGVVAVPEKAIQGGSDQ